MIRSRKTLWLLGGFALCFFVGGWVNWLVSYQTYLAGPPHLVEMAVLCAAVALVLPWFIGAGLVASALTVACAVTAIVLVRILMDQVQDPTSHNLLPFEIALAFVFGSVIAFPSAAVGWLLRRATHRARATGVS